MISIQSLLCEKPYHNEPGFEQVGARLEAGGVGLEKGGAGLEKGGAGLEAGGAGSERDERVWTE